MRIAVAGGTGLIGKLVVDDVRAAGHEPVVIARSNGVDLLTGVGLADALRGVQAVIDVSNVVTISAQTSVDFFGTATRNLLAAGDQAGVRHHVVLSIVGIDVVNLGYYAGKRCQEELVQGGPVPFSVLRATQFHEFAEQLTHRGGGWFAPVPRMRSQPVAAREVAQALVTLAVGAPVGSAPELAGPQQHDMIDLVRRVLRARGSRRRVLRLPVPGAVGRALAGGGLLPTGPGPRGVQTFDQWLAESTRL